MIRVGFESPLVGRTLRRAAEQVRDLCAPHAEREVATVKACDMSRKGNFENPAPVKRADFFNMFTTRGAV